MGWGGRRSGAHGGRARARRVCVVRAVAWSGREAVTIPGCHGQLDCPCSASRAGQPPVAPCVGVRQPLHAVDLGAGASFPARTADGSRSTAERFTATSGVGVGRRAADRQADEPGQRSRQRTGNEPVRDRRAAPNRSDTGRRDKIGSVSLRILPPPDPTARRITPEFPESSRLTVGFLRHRTGSRRATVSGRISPRAPRCAVAGTIVKPGGSALGAAAIVRDNLWAARTRTRCARPVTTPAECNPSYRTRPPARGRLRPAHVSPARRPPRRPLFHLGD